MLRRRLILLVPLLALFAFVATTEERTEAATWGCTGNDITPDEDIDAEINKDPSDRATTFCVSAGTYQVSAPAILKAGDKLIGQPGTTNPVQKCVAGSCVNTKVTQPIPVVKLVGSGTDNLLRARGTDIFIRWVDLTNASGTGNGAGAITAGSADWTFVVEYARIHDNASLGISNMKGTVRDSEFFRNSLKQSALGFNGSAVKGITEYEAARVFVHDEQGNGLWCDVGCSDDPNRVAFRVYDSVVVNNGRAGIRYENSMSTAWFEGNEVHGNAKIERRGGVDIRDSQDATVKSNVFGGATFRFISPENKAVTMTYPANSLSERIGIRATDSGRSDRVDLKEVVVRDNLMNNERIITCAGPVTCINNSGVGSR